MNSDFMICTRTYPRDREEASGSGEIDSLFDF